MSEEIWKNLENYQGYEVSSLGNVRSSRSGKPLKVHTNPRNLPCVTIRDKRSKKFLSVQVDYLVAEAFVLGQSKKENTVLHIDADVLNNRPDNLAWTSLWKASCYYREMLNPDAQRRYKRFGPVIDDLGNVYPTVLEAAKSVVALPSAIEYAVKYNENQHRDAYTNLLSTVVAQHKVYHSGRVFRSLRSYSPEPREKKLH